MGVEVVEELPPDPKSWRLHLKNNTPLDVNAVFQMDTWSDETKQFIAAAFAFMEPRTFEGLFTSQTIKAAQLPMEGIQEAVGMGMFEVVERDTLTGPHLHTGMHGVNVFALPEMKGRRRLITEPHLDSVINKGGVPKVSCPTRLGRRKSLRYAACMLRIDFGAFYDAIPLPEEVRNKFLFRKGDEYFRLRTLPTGATWGVAIGQAVTWTIVDIGSPVIIHTMIDNIPIAAPLGMEEEFLAAVRKILGRIEAANLLTSPERNELKAASDEELLTMSMQPNTFIGEECVWTGGERVVGNSVKTVAELRMALRATNFSCRTFASLGSLISYPLQKTPIPPASFTRRDRAGAETPGTGRWTSVRSAKRHTAWVTVPKTYRTLPDGLG